LNALVAWGCICVSTADTFAGVQHRTLEQGGLELAFKVTASPLLLNTHPQIKLTLLWPLALAQDDEVVGPGQLSHQRRDNVVALVGLVELPHAEKVAPGEAAQPGLALCDVGRQLRDHAITPLGR